MINLTPTTPELKSISRKVNVALLLYVVGDFLSLFSGAPLHTQNSDERSFGFLFCIALCITFGAYMILYSAMESLWQRAKSAILERDFEVYVDTMIVMSIIYAFVIIIISDDRISSKAMTFAVLILPILIGCVIYGIFLRYKDCDESTYTTNQLLFMVAFWLGITTLLFSFAFIIYVIMLIVVRELGSR